MGVAPSSLTGCWGSSGPLLLRDAHFGNADAVRERLELQPELASYTAFNDSSSIMHRAAAAGYHEVLGAVIGALSDFGASVAVSDKGDAKGRTTAAVQQFLQGVINQRTSAGQTPLMVACVNGNIECVELLLRAGADPFLVDKALMRTALHYAAAFGHDATLRLLLADGTRVDTQEGHVALRAAKVRDMSGVCSFVDTRSENGYTALHLAALSGTLPCMHALLAGGASMLVRTVDQGRSTKPDMYAGSTPLHAAAFRGDLGIVQAILQAHLDAQALLGPPTPESEPRVDLRSITNASRQLPYHIARQRGHRHIQRILNPTVAIDTALEECRASEGGFGPQKLATLAAYALRLGLLSWLHDAQAHKALDMLPATLRRRTSISTGAAPGGALLIPAAWPTAGATPAPLPRRPSALAPSAVSGTAGRAAERGHAPADVVAALHPRGMAATVDCPPLSSFCSIASSSASSSSSMGVREQDAVQRAGSGESDVALPSPFAAAAAVAFPDGCHRPACAGCGEADKDNHKSCTGSWHGGEPLQAPNRISITARASQSQVPTEQPLPRRATAPEQGLGFREQLHRHSSVRYVPSDDGSPRPASPPAEDLRAHSIDVDQESVGRDAGVSPPDFPPDSCQKADRGCGGQAGSSGGGGSGGGECSGGSSAPASPPRPHSRSIMRSLSTLARGLGGRPESQPSATPAQRMSTEGSVAAGQARASSRSNSVAAKRDEEEEDCGVCLDADEEVAINGCDHMLCVECAISLCMAHKKPPMCPFCRRIINGFHHVGV